ncbi:MULTISPECIES: adenosine deaminase [Streptomyces]|uniref:Adenine deaminase n=1 Tax=Streptomyces tsukubensis (strain DSM 42081 / NBRC 108919 / NRRL 18488 / 9993) TaxID=1114943 RepID=I2MY02_STRT9|nr:adenosine deaminase [Streptomyces tsukubensis]MYS67167.1 adenosine deaminase [Streptomyces sp. SID5473]AZK94002.1 adenosine deaminase [Streptomyces tsukubensis]EIF89649.1 adenosine deaminase [Streptomyces tsukubensis NRRL18488]QKM69881.1 adenosine deaminase [Streptomyces tsukubensis NRRL18488]TAI46145.1 adenosine deaminase [Streptomyces tsukubensis]
MPLPLPKAELHLHIEGTLEPELAFALADRNGVTLPYRDTEELRRAYLFDDLQSFLDLYYGLMTVLRTADDFAELTDAYLARAAAQGVRHAEIFFDPQAHTARGVPLGTVVEGLGRALDAAPGRYGISTRLIMCFLRDLPAESAMETLRAAEPYLDRITGIGLDSAEVGHPPAKFKEVYEAAAALGLRRVAHAGEEGPASYIREALDVLGVERIDHGLRCLEDGELVDRLVRERMPLTLCPLSNVRLRAVDTLEEHPLPRMMAAGLLCTVNSDDPAYFGGYVGDTFHAVREALGLGPEELRELARNSFEASFLDDDEERRAELIAAVDAYVFTD